MPIIEKVFFSAVFQPDSRTDMATFGVNVRVSKQSSSRVRPTD